ncbi:hypothetical protein [Paractinoplanes hotanensis]|uniref:Uncharacterized protein n=1 Tax=Paractinoplanes hotanensis TaxID=2906497 RepID=A0ABT0Y845_9ACTN|nr:hypothetical protein [Actinoplanes hotanensis]MCM4082216.1 hypothetical protein [Actinoplanes hotanensis]
MTTPPRHRDPHPTSTVRSPQAPTGAVIAAMTRFGAIRPAHEPAWAGEVLSTDVPAQRVAVVPGSPSRTGSTLL